MRYLLLIFSCHVCVAHMGYKKQRCHPQGHLQWQHDASLRKRISSLLLCFIKLECLTSNHVIPEGEKCTLDALMPFPRRSLQSNYSLNRVRESGGQNQLLNLNRSSVPGELHNLIYPIHSVTEQSLWSCFF